MISRSSTAAAVVSLALFAASGLAPFAAGTAVAQTAAAAGAPTPPRVSGYLGAERIPDHNVFLPAPPAADSPMGKADVAVFEATRALENTPRWALAQRDDRIGQKVMLTDFGCVVGVDLGAVDAPAISRVIARAGADLFPMIGASKDKYARPRPFVTEQGPVCITPSEGFARSGSYPSGHSASGWLYALLLAEIDPDNAAAIVTRGRMFGESRVVCGVHYVSDVEGGRIAATALVAALHSSAEFEADMDAARAELAALRAAASSAKTDAAACAADGAHTATPW
jgi:acid phosphatase (class A)